MPTFLGSSFAFIAALQAVIGGDKANIPKAMGGIIVAGAFYVLLALLIPGCSATVSWTSCSLRWFGAWGSPSSA